eukprot:538909_1
MSVKHLNVLLAIVHHKSLRVKFDGFRMSRNPIKIRLFVNKNDKEEFKQYKISWWNMGRMKKRNDIIVDNITYIHGKSRLAIYLDQMLNSVASYESKITNPDQFYTLVQGYKQVIKFNNEWITIIKNHDLLHKPTVLGKQILVIHRLVHELKMYELNPNICCQIWLEFLNKNIDPMSVVKLRKICQDMEQEQIPGRILLEYENSNVLNEIPNDIKHIEWKKYIQQYTERRGNYMEPKQQISTDHKTNDSERLQTFLHIMSEYDTIMQRGGLEVIKLQKFFMMMEKEITMSQILDTLFDIQHEKIQDCEDVQKNYQCNLKHDCKILLTVTQRRNNGFSRKQYHTNNSNNNHGYQSLSLDEYSKMDLLNLTHVKLCHRKDIYGRLVSNRRDIMVTNVEEQAQMDGVFIDKLEADESLNSLCLFCQQEEYDTEALFDDIYPDNDMQSKIYHFFKNKLKTKMNKYYSLKENISNCSIQPIDQNAMKRNLIELDFGDHVADWNVKPQFDDMKQ